MNYKNLTKQELINFLKELDLQLSETYKRCDHLNNIAQEYKNHIKTLEIKTLDQQNEIANLKQILLSEKELATQLLNSQKSFAEWVADHTNFIHNISNRSFSN